MRSVLVIDGPARGQIRHTDSARFQAVGDNLTRSPGDEFPSELRVTRYHVHKFMILGRMMRLASVHLSQDDIPYEDVFEHIISDKAKDATE